MRDINRRLKKVEQALNLSEKPKTVTIVYYGDTIPPDKKQGNITTHFVLYKELYKEKDQ
jgi:hypothetical protein